MSPRSQFVDATLLTTSHYIGYYIRRQASRVALLSTRYHLCEPREWLSPVTYQLPALLPCSPAAPSSWRCYLVAGPSSTSALLRPWRLVSAVHKAFSEVMNSLRSAVSASLAVWHLTSGLEACREGWQRVRNSTSSEDRNVSHSILSGR